GNSIIIVATPVGNNADNSLSRTMTIAVNPSNTTAPTAAFTFNPAAPEVGQVVTFDALSATSPPGPTLDEGVACTTCTFTWDFGGDGTATGRVVTHAFTAAGSYIVKLIAV